ncbi:MAG: hypothetical protein PHS82_14335 [Lachnospiraceae bacterium]|nr:hypothetical protein [Lachnospiraceae bacterium]
MLQETSQFIHEHILKLFFVIFGASGLLTVAFVFIYVHNPLDAIEEIQSFKSATANLVTADSQISFWNLLFHNLGAGTLYLLLGLIPPLSIIVIILLAKSLGAALIYSQSMNAIPVWKIFCLVSFLTEFLSYRLFFYVFPWGYILEPTGFGRKKSTAGNRSQRIHWAHIFALFFRLCLSPLPLKLLLLRR